MMDFVQEINRIIHTLEQVNVPATYDNLKYMLGAQHRLAEVRDMLAASMAAESKPAEEVANDA